MSTHDIQLTLQAHLNHASVATSQQELEGHLDAFSRDWKQEPTLEQFDAGLSLLRDQKSPATNESVSLWWLGYVQDCVLSEHIGTLSPELNQGMKLQNLWNERSYNPTALLDLRPNLLSFLLRSIICASLRFCSSSQGRRPIGQSPSKQFRNHC
jgi:hypothetical protein